MITRQLIKHFGDKFLLQHTCSICVVCDNLGYKPFGTGVFVICN